MTEENLLVYCLDLMARAENVSVSSIDQDGFPQIRIMFNLRNGKKFPKLVPFFRGHDRDLVVYLGTNASSAKIAQLKADPAIAVLYSDDAAFHSLMLSGLAEIVDDPSVKNALWQDGWEIYYPAGPADPDYAVLRLRPLKAKGWRGGHVFSFALGKG